MTPRAVVLLAGLVVALTMAVAPPASAGTGPQAGAAVTPSGRAPGLVIVGPVPGNAPATFPVQDLTMPVEDLVFPVASLDGAVTDSGDRDFTLRSDVLFAFDKAELTGRARSEITRIAKLLAAPGASTVPGTQGRVTTVTVTGYTDAKGSDSYNLDLSRRRARAVQGALSAALGSAGITVRAVGRGEDDPISTNRTKQGQALNRRVEIRGS